MDQADVLLAEILERPADQWSAAVDELCQRHPAQADELRRRYAVLERAGVGAESDGDPDGSEAAFPEDFGPYQLVERLGGGGMGIVYLARHRDLGRHVALKLVRPERLYFADARERFKREVEAVARLEHPGCVQIHQVGEAEGVPYFAMEHITGISLDRVIAKLAGRPVTKLTGRDLAAVLQQASGRAVETATTEVFSAPWSRVCLRLALAVADALAHAHARGVVHRDVKPSNIMLTPEGRVVVIDFGLAVAEGTSRMTRSGAFLGSLPYMAPEQVLGDKTAIDARTDVYALGVCLYELLTLVSPFESASVETTRTNILAGKTVPLRRRNPAVGSDLAVLCAMAMDVDPRRRYQHMSDFAADLGATLDHRTIAARPAGVQRAVVNWSRRHPVAATVALLSTLALVFGPLIVSLAIAAQRDRALDAERLARRREYTANLAAANAALLGGNGPEARRRLDACAADARGFEWRHLDLALDGALLTLKAHRSEVTAVALSRDGTRIASGARNGELAIFDATTGARLRTLPTNEQPVAQVEFNADASELVVSHGRDLMVFAVADGSLLRERPPETNRASMFVYPGATGAASDLGGGRIAEFDLRTLAPTREVQLQGGSELPLGFFLCDGERLLAPLSIGGVATWDLRTGALLGQVDTKHAAQCLSVQPGLKRLACADEAGNLTWCDNTPGSTAQALGTGGRVIRDVALVRDGHHLVAGSEAGELLVFALPSGRLERTLYGHRGPARVLAIGTECDFLVTGGEDGTVRLWSPYLAPDALDLRTESGASLAVVSDGSLILGTQDSLVRRLDTDTGLVRWQSGNPHWINSLALVDGGRAVAFSFHTALRVVDIETGATRAEIVFPAETGYCHHLVVEPTGRRAFLAGLSGSVVAIDLLAGRVVGSTKAHEGEVFGLVFDAATGHLLSCGNDGRIVETPADLGPSRVLASTDAPISTLLLDGHSLLTSERRALVRRARQTGEVLLRQPCPNYFITMVTMGPDRLITGSQDGRIGFWDRRELELMVELKQPAQAIWKLAPDPAGNWLAVNCDRGSARILYARSPAAGDLAAARARARGAAGRELAAHTMAWHAWQPAATRAIEARGDLSPEFKGIALGMLPVGGLYYLAIHARSIGASPASATLRHDDLIRSRDLLFVAATERPADAHATGGIVGLALVQLRLGEFAAAIATLRDVDRNAEDELEAEAAFVRASAYRALGDAPAADAALAQLEALIDGGSVQSMTAQMLLEELRATRR